MPFVTLFVTIIQRMETTRRSIDRTLVKYYSTFIKWNGMERCPRSIVQWKDKKQIATLWANFAENQELICSA